MPEVLSSVGPVLSVHAAACAWVQTGLTDCRAGVCLALACMHPDCMKGQAGACETQKTLWSTVSRVCWSLHHGDLLDTVSEGTDHGEQAQS